MEKGFFVFLVILSMVFTLFSGMFLFGAAMGEDRIQKEAIEVGVGRYNNNTSDFEWIKK